MKTRTYTIEELKSLISESASEIKAKINDDITKTNKKENNKTYKETKNKIKNFDGGGNESSNNKKIDDKIDDNKTTLDYDYDTNMGDNFRDKVKAQSEGYTSTIEKNNNIEKSGDFNSQIYNYFKKNGKQLAKNKVITKKTGLTARQLPDETFEKQSIYTESKKISVLNFKNTVFINESHMISRIPDDFKVNGKRFKMKDSNENEFIVEWNEGEPNILSYENKKNLNESIKKYNKLINYKSNDFFKKSTNKSRINENTEFNNILNKTRTITK